ncbi:hypothetical protein L2703_17790 [Shewanella basaltis]|uniref:hypothetical protein n=1 Tax=Shewanella basaltis TaxID=472183 RepID=UPI002010BFF8|nr:hypothetical protein [Shewanella basaltis]MCL1115424.1 hypothetical protein [Shewanella basaltis]
MLAIFIVALCYFFMGSYEPKYQTKYDWTTEEKASLCKAYIADQFGKPLHIIQFQRVDIKGWVYVSYNRPADNTTWDYVCKIEGAIMVWAGRYDGEWGRWRVEDQVRVRYNPETKIASFTSIQ